jgi:hypothetical protein
MGEEAEVSKHVNAERERLAAQRASYRTRAARWDLDVAVFFFAILTIVVILLFEGVGIEFVAPAAVLGLALGWLMGWRKGKQLYEIFYEEELAKLERESKETAEGAIEETIEEKVQKAMQKRWEEWR